MTQRRARERRWRYSPEGVLVDRRREILDTAAELFAKQGAGSTTVRQIADSIGIGSGSLYHHFASKDEILAEILGSYLEDLTGTYRELLRHDMDPLTRLRELVTCSLQAAVRHPHAAEIYQDDIGYLRGADQDAFAHILKLGRSTSPVWIEVITAGVQQGQLRDDIPVSTFYRLIRDAVWLSVRWYHPSPEYPVEQFARDTTAIFVDGYRRVTP